MKALICSFLCGGFSFKGGRESALHRAAASGAVELAAAAPALASAGGCSVSSEAPSGLSRSLCCAPALRGRSKEPHCTGRRPAPPPPRPDLAFLLGRDETKGFIMPALALSPTSTEWEASARAFLSGTANISEKSVLGFPKPHIVRTKLLDRFSVLRSGSTG